MKTQRLNNEQYDLYKSYLEDFEDDLDIFNKRLDHLNSLSWRKSDTKLSKYINDLYLELSFFDKLIILILDRLEYIIENFD